ncbi:MAG: bifunctional DNA-formamidopyrimidine glycosylase/DNA-(apurinic or apyrimidinic site) lyase [Acidimicrobiia bacterium]|nr:bifunctional DNA-formamidopyrimidine glycosylase/DNA-(apurinic or apyrimidinic site) lyase [Acidimicrobiia bacterium]
MPELPEVETLRRQLAPELVNRRVLDAWGYLPPKFDQAPAAVGARFGAVQRLGKYLVAELSGGRELVLHLGMTGKLSVPTTSQWAPGPYTRAWWQLDDGRTLVFDDTRRFGRLAVVDAGDYTGLPTLAALGPDPFDPDLDGEVLWRALRRSSARVKTQLLSQRPIAGVGNIYADEALWRCGVHPASRSVTRAQASALLDALRAVLAAGISHGGTTLRDYRTLEGTSGENQDHLDCYGRAGHACARCASLLRSRVYDGRTSTFCPTCQRQRPAR